MAGSSVSSSGGQSRSTELTRNLLKTRGQLESHFNSISRRAADFRKQKLALKEKELSAQRQAAKDEKQASGPWASRPGSAFEDSKLKRCSSSGHAPNSETSGLGLRESSSSPVLRTTWHGSPFLAEPGRSTSPGEAFDRTRFGASLPVSSHPAPHPGAVTARPHSRAATPLRDAQATSPPPSPTVASAPGPAPTSSATPAAPTSPTAPASPTSNTTPAALANEQRGGLVSTVPSILPVRGSMPRISVAAIAPPVPALVERGKASHRPSFALMAPPELPTKVTSHRPSFALMAPPELLKVGRHSPDVGSGGGGHQSSVSLSPPVVKGSRKASIAPEFLLAQSSGLGGTAKDMKDLLKGANWLDDEDAPAAPASRLSRASFSVGALPFAKRRDSNVLSLTRRPSMHPLMFSARRSSLHPGLFSARRRGIPAVVLDEPDEEELEESWLAEAEERYAAEEKAIADLDSYSGTPFSKKPSKDAAPETIGRLGDFMALLGPRYKTVDRDKLHERAEAGDLGAFQRRLREEKRQKTEQGAVRDGSPLHGRSRTGSTDYIAVGVNRHSQPIKPLHQIPDSDPDGAARAAWLNARAQEVERRARKTESAPSSPTSERQATMSPLKLKA